MPFWDCCSVVKLVSVPQIYNESTLHQNTVTRNQGCWSLGTHALTLTQHLNQTTGNSVFTCWQQLSWCQSGAEAQSPDEEVFTRGQPEGLLFVLRKIWQSFSKHVFPSGTCVVYTVCSFLPALPLARLVLHSSVHKINARTKGRWRGPLDQIPKAGDDFPSMLSRHSRPLFVSWVMPPCRLLSECRCTSNAQVPLKTESPLSRSKFEI